MTLYSQMKAMLPDWASDLVIAGVRGSDAHGTKLAPDTAMGTDDTDLFGVAVRRPEVYLGLPYHPKAQQQFATDGQDLDILVYDVRKFFYLLTKGNPNVMSWLWARPEDQFIEDQRARWLIANRDAFISQQCLNALAGYARAQLHKMERSQYAGYMGKKRKKIVDQIGYDVKHAGHCVRLLWMGRELAEKGTMYTYRPEHEREIIMQIKRGEMNLREIKRLAEHAWKEFQTAEKAADLPKGPDMDIVNEMLVELIRDDR